MRLSDLYGKTGGLADLLGIEEVYEEAGAICVPLTLEEAHLNHAGEAHGGAISALVDVAVGAYQKWHGNRAAVLSSALNFFRPVPLGARLVASVTPQKLGRLVSVFTVCVRAEETLIAQATVSTFARGE